LGSKACDISTCGVNWRHTLPPVVLPHWPMRPPPNGPLSDVLTTIGNWRAYGSIQHNGTQYGQKVHSIRQIIDLPRRTQQRMALAMTIHPQEARDLALLKENGWELLDPTIVASTPARYRRLICRSRGEIGIAKSGYVVSRSGWFSDRSACYLASGRPVIAQDTGFSRQLPVGHGLFAFSSAGEAVGAIERMNADYPAHCIAARRLAEEYFDSDRVLARLLSLAEVLE
jgi:hypothetical protein